MERNEELYNERLTRFKKAIALEKPDKTPMQFNGDAFNARLMGVKLSEMAVNTELSINTIISSVDLLGGIDVVDMGAVYAPIIGLGNLARTKVPGRELPEGVMWQVNEIGGMEAEDYDVILDKGFEAYFNNWMETKSGLDFDEMEAAFEKFAEAPKRYKDAGYVLGATIVSSCEVDYLSGGRTMGKFTRDLYRMPDKIHAVLDVISEYHNKNLKQMMDASPEAITVFIGAGRGACDFYTPKIWEEVVWKYYEKAAETVIGNGKVVQWHMDGNYERGLDYFRKFDKGTCIFAPDGIMDIYKVKEVLGDKMCIRGDVRPGLLALGTPAEVYSYASKLKNDMGDGFVMGVGCCIPLNAKLENVKAMIAAASGL